MSWQDQVRAFHRAIGVETGGPPAINKPWLRANLIAEEAAETIGALGIDVHMTLFHDEQSESYIEAGEPDLVGVADGIVDLLYVAIGAAVECNIDIEPIFVEVQRANMEKASGPKRADGKQLKPEGWQPPRVQELVDQQIRAYQNRE